MTVFILVATASSRAETGTDNVSAEMWLSRLLARQFSMNDKAISDFKIAFTLDKPVDPELTIDSTGSDCFLVLNVRLDRPSFPLKWDGSVDQDAPTSAAVKINLRSLIPNATQAIVRDGKNFMGLVLGRMTETETLRFVFNYGTSTRWEDSRHGDYGEFARGRRNPYWAFVPMRFLFEFREDERDRIVSVLKGVFQKCS